jgi:hypothetical protein
MDSRVSRPFGGFAFWPSSGRGLLSFASTGLTEHGFFADWDVDEHNNLCTPGLEKSKVDAVRRFLESRDTVLVCTLGCSESSHPSSAAGRLSRRPKAADFAHGLGVREGWETGSLGDDRVTSCLLTRRVFDRLQSRSVGELRCRE